MVDIPYGAAMSPEPDPLAPPNRFFLEGMAGLASP